MAEPLKNHFGPDVPGRIASAIAEVYASFDVDGFVRDSLDGFDDLELTPRGLQIAGALATHLPAKRDEALAILVASFGPELPNEDPTGTPTAKGANPMESFFYMPHGFFIRDEGVEHFDASMRANYELTKRHTAEFSIRSNLEHHTDATLAVLHDWTQDENVHVRRLVSEGTRPRLPWAGRLKQFQLNPTPVIELLELLKDDPVEYVRRSVANNLNDLAKDHPDRVVGLARVWWADGDANRRRLLRHGLRTLIKQGDPETLDVLGYPPDTPATVESASFDPATPAIGEKVRIEVVLSNPSTSTIACLVDLRINFVKANGSTSPKVFKGAELELEAGANGTIRKTVSLAQHTTRTHHPGDHLVELILNGRAHQIGSFTVT